MRSISLVEQPLAMVKQRLDNYIVSRRPRHHTIFLESMLKKNMDLYHLSPHHALFFRQKVSTSPALLLVTKKIRAKFFLTEFLILWATLVKLTAKRIQ